MSELYVSWEWPIESRPADLWPLVSDTDRFNADSGVPAIEQLGQSQFLRRLRLSILGINVEWEEQPFEWQHPERFGVVRKYLSGPLAEMRVLTELSEQPSRLRYQVWATPRNWLCSLLVRAQLLASGRRFARTVRAYDEIAVRQTPEIDQLSPVRFTAGGENRLERARRELVSAGASETLLHSLCRLIRCGSNFDVHRMRPYEYARRWNAERRETLELFLRAARAGMLELQWELMCPLCRGAKQRSSELGGVQPHVHCEACCIDFHVDLNQSVELTFRPNIEIREIKHQEYCVGGPQNTPHIVLQQVIEPGGRRELSPSLATGFYRFRRWGNSSSRVLCVVEDGGLDTLILDGDGGSELRVSTRPRLVLENTGTETSVMVLERLAWSDEAATAAEVTALQVFRDLFPTESLRPALPLSAGTMTVLFTDIVDSASLYRELGDAMAFGHILQQQKTLSQHVEEEGGAVIKTIGDRAMAVFRHPITAVRAARKAQSSTGATRLRIAIHTGPAVAVTLNDRLDYFGATVNLAARITSLSNGYDIVATRSVVDDCEVRAWLEAEGIAVQTTSTEPVEIVRLNSHPPR